MPTHRNIPPNLVKKAQSGKFTRSNTAPGTPERQAVDRVAYLRRRARHPELTARQATGHFKPPQNPPRISLMVSEPPRFIVLEGLGRRDLSRAGRYNDLVHKLDTGRPSPAAFSRRVRSWRPIEGFKFLADPDAVLALLDLRRAGDREIFVYESGRS
jgi:hypothetical protein